MYRRKQLSCILPNTGIIWNLQTGGGGGGGGGIEETTQHVDKLSKLLEKGRVTLSTIRCGNPLYTSQMSGGDCR